jgi:hypothetical protein
LGRLLLLLAAWVFVAAAACRVALQGVHDSKGSAWMKEMIVACGSSHRIRQCEPHEIQLIVKTC